VLVVLAFNTGCMAGLDALVYDWRCRRAARDPSRSEPDADA